MYIYKKKHDPLLLFTQGDRKYGGRAGSKRLMFAAAMEGVTVGQVFDAECILSKRPRKVRAGPPGGGRPERV